MRGLLDHFCIVYLDDILVFSKDRNTHTQYLYQVLKRMRQMELYANPKKCEFYRDQVEFLGYILSTSGVSIDLKRISTVMDWKEPSTFWEIQVFLGFCNYYRRFIEGYSEIAAPLTEQLKGVEKGKKPGALVLPPDALAAFYRLKAAFKTLPLLSHFNPIHYICLEMDGSNVAIAGILLQPDN